MSLTIQECATRMGKTYARVQQLTQEGKLPSTRKWGRVFVAEKDLVKFMAKPAKIGRPKNPVRGMEE